MLDACVIVPAYDAAKTIAGVIADVRALMPELEIIVVDDGSTDRTADIAKSAGALVVAHAENRGKGCALMTGFEAARGKRVALTIDADGQHPAAEAKRVLEGSIDAAALVIGVRDLATAGAPRANQMSNGISNFFLSRFAQRPLKDTQCGLRRYPISETLALRARGQRYDFEAAVLLRAIWSGLPVVEVPIEVLYPADRTTHFHSARDPWRIIRTIVATLGDRWLEPTELEEA
jgi:glycosyltransferase involved in cell wall biosynthesis